MRGIESRLAKVERAMHLTQAPQVDEAALRADAEWRAAGGPVSFVCGDTEDDARQREATLRDLGLIQSIDRVVRMPMQPDYAKPFLRHCLLEEWGRRSETRSKPHSPHQARRTQSNGTRSRLREGQPDARDCNATEPP